MKFYRLVNYGVLTAIFFTFTFLLFTVSAVHAQGLPADLRTVTLTPNSDNPFPGQVVTIDATSYSFDINTATIIWVVDGKQAQKGIGLTTIDVKAPDLGKKKTVEVTAVTPDGSRFTSTYVVGSGSIDMILETDGYVPPFFKGKTPLAFQNSVTVIAVPHLVNSSGKEYDPATLIYQWKKDDGTVLQDQSGYGKQSITIKGGIVPRPYYLIVTASPRDNSSQGQSLIQIAPTSPSITFYEDDPLYGPLFNKAISNPLHIGSERETKAFASLFGFNFSQSIANDLTVNWLINDIKHDELSQSQSVILRAPDGVSGTSHIDLTVRGINNILQGANSGFDVKFDASSPKTNTNNPITL